MIFLICIPASTKREDKLKAFTLRQVATEWTLTEMLNQDRITVQQGQISKLIEYPSPKSTVLKEQIKITRMGEFIIRAIGVRTRVLMGIHKIKMISHLTIKTGGHQKDKTSSILDFPRLIRGRNHKIVRVITHLKI